MKGNTLPSITSRTCFYVQPCCPGALDNSDAAGLDIQLPVTEVNTYLSPHSDTLIDLALQLFCTTFIYYTLQVQTLPSFRLMAQLVQCMTGATGPDLRYSCLKGTWKNEVIEKQLRGRLASTSLFKAAHSHSHQAAIPQWSQGPIHKLCMNTSVDKWSCQAAIYILAWRDITGQDCQESQILLCKLLPENIAVFPDQAGIRAWQSEAPQTSLQQSSSSWLLKTSSQVLWSTALLSVLWSSVKARERVWRNVIWAGTE